MAAAGNQETERTLVRHWQAFGAGDVDAIMADYAEDAVLIAPDGPLKGHAAIRALFANVFANMFPPKSTSLSLDKQIIEGRLRISRGREDQSFIAPRSERIHS